MKRRGRSRVAFVVVDFPDDDEVLAHGFRFRPAWWTPRVSDGWGGFLEQLPAQDRGYCPSHGPICSTPRRPTGCRKHCSPVTCGEPAARHSSSGAEHG